MIRFKKVLIFSLAMCMAVGLSACGSSKKKDSGKDAVGMITDTGGINDQSFNQSAWEGLQTLKKEKKVDVSYIESKQASDFVTNLERMSEKSKLTWGVGFACADAIITVANKNKDRNFAIVDNSYGDKTPDNVTGVLFKAEEPSFMVGYIAGRTTQTNKVGFVGGMKSEAIDQFQFGYEAGVAYAAKELGKEITVDIQYAESFSDAAKGKAIANKMYSNGCDILYHAAGGTGVGVIEAAKDGGKLVIGVDRDQASLAPDNVLTSALKLVGKAVNSISADLLKGTKIGGKTYTFGLKEDCVGIPENHKNMSDEVYNDTLKLAEKIKKGEIVPPATTDALKEFLGTLK